MFKFIKKLQTKEVVNTTEVIEAIHNEFDTAGEKLMKEAKEILAGEYDTDKGERLKKLGFGNSKAAIDAATVLAMKKEKREIAEKVEYFTQWYPNYKFITEGLVKRICAKYGLVFGDVSYYKGDVPEKNVREMENFQLRQEDYFTRISDVRFNNLPSYDYYIVLIGQLGQQQRNTDLPSLEYYYEQSKQKYLTTENTESEVSKVKHSFKICAPESDFDMTHLKREGHKLELNIPDPIVLHPVKGGYLIVSKWGLEGQDESLVNEKLN